MTPSRSDRRVTAEVAWRGQRGKQFRALRGQGVGNVIYAYPESSEVNIGKVLGRVTVSEGLRS